MSTPLPDNATQDVFDDVLARPVAAPALEHGRLIHVQWSAPEQGERLVQLYVNNALAGYTRDPREREAWLSCGIGRHHQIELLAVEPADVGVSCPALLVGAEPATQPTGSFALLRDESLPLDATLGVAIDGGQVVKRTALFAADTPRAGFGAVFGEGGFGYDASTGPGLGYGDLGYGPLGADGRALRWRDDTLSPGDHTLTISLNDADGRAVVPDLDLNLTIARLPEPPTDLTLDDNLQLTWN